MHNCFKKYREKSICKKSWMVRNKMLLNEVRVKTNLKVIRK